MACGCQGVCGTPKRRGSRGLVYIPALIRKQGWRTGKTLGPERTGLENSQRAEIVSDQAKHLCSKNNNCVLRARDPSPYISRLKELKTKMFSVMEQRRGKERERVSFSPKQTTKNCQNIVGPACQPLVTSQSRNGSENSVMNSWQPFGLAC